MVKKIEIVDSGEGLGIKTENISPIETIGMLEMAKDAIISSMKQGGPSRLVLPNIGLGELGGN